MDNMHLKVPKLRELDYRKELLQDKETMSYNRGYDQDTVGYNYDEGTISKSNEDWVNWYNIWCNNAPERYYAYIMLDDSPIGDVALHYNDDFDCYIVHILLENKYRGKGYSKYALNLLLNEAFNKLKISKVCCRIPTDRISAIKMFNNMGFKEENIKLSDIRYNKRETSVFLSITKSKYNMNKKIKV